MTVTKYCDVHGSVVVDESEPACPACQTLLKAAAEQLVGRAMPFLTSVSSANVTPNARDSEELSAKRRRQGAFLASYEECGRINIASTAAGIDRRTYFRWMKEPDFARDFVESDQIATQELLDHATKMARGLDGATTSERLLIRLLEAKVPTLFNRVDRHEHTGANGGPIILDGNPSEQLLSRIAGLTAGRTETQGS